LLERPQFPDIKQYPQKPVAATTTATTATAAEQVQTPGSISPNGGETPTVISTKKLTLADLLKRVGRLFSTTPDLHAAEEAVQGAERYGQGP